MNRIEPPRLSERRHGPRVRQSVAPDHAGVVTGDPRLHHPLDEKPLHRFGDGGVASCHAAENVARDFPQPAGRLRGDFEQVSDRELAGSASSESDHACDRDPIGVREWNAEAALVRRAVRQAIGKAARIHGDSLKIGAAVVNSLDVRASVQPSTSPTGARTVILADARDARRVATHEASADASGNLRRP
jgi:hypothetical protein